MSKGHDWANPAPAGLVALAMACFTFFALLTGRVDHSAIGLLGCWLIGGFVIQVIVGLIELKEGNSTGGNVFTYFSAFFMLVSGMEMLFKYFAGVYGWQIDARIDGWAWLPLAIALILWTPAYFKSPLSLLVAVLALDPAVLMISLMDMGVLAKTYSPIAGNLLFIAGIFGLYTASAIILNTAFGRTILPMGSPLVKQSTSAGISSAH
ncbi:acetate uptake transporter family protein [Desulfolucanica intricata]|uniref:acetate uptake transporter family protein n=1 Tax=Desulfolucanica intricata TaxID=1285191 RepID=UPI000833C248|nr:GPR1/FUN34/YaaH family transporter [Desulfolucanica intricata]